VPRKAHLLLVDDDPNTLASLSRAFRLAGHEATVCDNANRAVELLQTQRFDLILSKIPACERPSCWSPDRPTSKWL